MLIGCNPHPFGATTCAESLHLPRVPGCSKPHSLAPTGFPNQQRSPMQGRASCLLRSGVVARARGRHSPPEERLTPRHLRGKLPLWVTAVAPQGANPPHTYHSGSHVAAGIYKIGQHHIQQTAHLGPSPRLELHRAGRRHRGGPAPRALELARQRGGRVGEQLRGREGPSRANGTGKETNILLPKVASDKKDSNLTFSTTKARMGEKSSEPPSGGMRPRKRLRYGSVTVLRARHAPCWVEQPVRGWRIRLALGAPQGADMNGTQHVARQMRGGARVARSACACGSSSACACGSSSACGQGARVFSSKACGAVGACGAARGSRERLHDDLGRVREPREHQADDQRRVVQVPGARGGQGRP
jgi:hypothetical protein